MTAIVLLSPLTFSNRFFLLTSIQNIIYMSDSIDNRLILHNKI